MDISLYPLLPTWVVALGTLAALALVWRGSARGRASIAAGPRRLLLALRVLTILLVAFMLLCPGRVVTEKNPERSQVVVLLDRSGSMATADLDQGETRLDAARRWLQDRPFPRLRDYPRRGFAFNHDAAACPTGELDALTAIGGTDLRQAVECVDKDVGLGQVAGLVLLSDGVDYSGFRGEELSVGVYSVRFGSDLTRARDLGVGAVECPRRVAAREEIDIRIPLRLSGFSRPREVRLQVHMDDRVLVDEGIELTPGREAERQLTAYLDAPGLHLLRIKVDRLEQEVSHLNNEREIAVEAVEAKDEVVAYFPLLTTSFRPLLRELQRHADTTFTAVYRVTEGAYRLRGTRLNDAYSDGVPTSAQTMRTLTAFILAASNGDLVSLPEAQVLEDYVREGGALVLLGGADSFGELPAASPLRQLSPVVHLPGGSFQAGRYVVRVPEGETGAFAERLRQIIRNNPPDDDFALAGVNRVQDVKTGARVLLEADDGARQPLVVVQPFGKGKVMAVLTNSLHLWGGPATREANFGEFWRQLLSVARNVSDKNDLLRVSVNRHELAVGDTLTVSAVARVPGGGVLAGLTVSATLLDRTADGKVVREIELRPRADTWTGAFEQLSAGRYVLKVASRQDAEVLRERFLFIRVGEIVQEQQRLAVREADFRRFSSAAHVYQPEETDRLQADLLRAVRKNEIRREQFLVFETPAFFLALVVLLLGEWLLRRRHNLF